MKNFPCCADGLSVALRRGYPTKVATPGPPGLLRPYLGGLTGPLLGHLDGAPAPPHLSAPLPPHLGLDDLRVELRCDLCPHPRHLPHEVEPRCSHVS